MFIKDNVHIHFYSKLIFKKNNISQRVLYPKIRHKCRSFVNYIMLTLELNIENLNENPFNDLTNRHTKQQHLHSLQFNHKAIETFQHLQHQQQFNVLDAASPGLFRPLTPSSNSFIQI